MTSLDALLADADFPTRDLSICLKGSLVAEWEEADDALVRASAAHKAAADAKMPMGYPTRDRDEAAARLAEVEERMRAASVELRLTALTTTKYQQLKNAHPVRLEEDGAPNMLDLRVGFNTLTFWKPLIRACLIVPNMTDDQFDRLCDRLTYRQFDLLSAAAHSLNERTDGQIPFSYAASDLIESSGETSSKPEPSESPSEPSGATGGPAKKAPKASRRSGTTSPVT